VIKLNLIPLKVPAWPAGDRHAWEQARNPVGTFDDGGLAAIWSPSTCRHVEQGYGTFLAWLELTGRLDVDVLPADRVTQDRLNAFLDAYALGRAQSTIGTTVKGIAYYHRAVTPSEGLPWLTKLAHRMMNTATPSRPKLPRIASIAELIRLGRWLMAQGQKDVDDGKVSGAQLYRDGLIIASLAVRPMRRRNLCGLRVNHSFTREGNSFRVRFSGKETKKGTRIDFCYPIWLVEPFEIYLRDMRPVLLKPEQKDEGWLWIGRRGRRLPANNMTTNVTNATDRYLDRAIPPHLFRDCATTDIALHDPVHIGIARDVLGHKTLASSQKFYNQAGSISALEKLSDVLSEILKG
jgi:integrase/recombinase XerC